MKKITTLILMFSLLLVASCGNGKEAASKKNIADGIATIGEDQIGKLYEDPGKYKYETVRLTGAVVGDPEYKDNSVSFEIVQNPESYTNSTKINYSDKSIELADGDYVSIFGTVVDTYETFDLAGLVTGPVINAASVELSSYDKVVAPALVTKEVNQSIDQLGYEVVLERVEFAEEETRLYVTVNNNGSDIFHVYDISTLAYQDSVEYQDQSNYSADYPEINYDLEPAGTTSGIICLPALDPNKQLIVDIEGYSENYDEEFGYYEFVID